MPKNNRITIGDCPFCFLASREFEGAVSVMLPSEDKSEVKDDCIREDLPHALKRVFLMLVLWARNRIKLRVGMTMLSNNFRVWSITRCSHRHFVVKFNNGANGSNCGECENPVGTGFAEDDSEIVEAGED